MRGGEVAAPAGVDVETLRESEPGAPLLLHVTNGESAGNTLRQTALGGAVLPWQDVLHEGPVPAVPRPQLLRERAAFLADCGWGSERAILASLERRDSQLTDALAGGVQVVLWFEHDLYDQLQLLDALALSRGTGVAPELIVVGSFPGRPDFHGLGELTADELETLWPERRAGSTEILDAAAAAWDAFRAPSPERIAGFARHESPELPFLRAALERLLEELPAPGNGLSRTERQALQVIADGARTPGEAFLATQHLEQAPFLGDAWFLRALSGLSRGDGRLVETRDGEEIPPSPPLGDAQRFVHLPLRLTGQGESVLAGDADRVALLGVDRWIGGTHLTTERAWRWDPARRVLVAPS